jgi:hypothetical protein
MIRGSSAAARGLDMVELAIIANILHLDADAILARARRVIRHR